MAERHHWRLVHPVPRPSHQRLWCLLGDHTNTGTRQPHGGAAVRIPVGKYFYDEEETDAVFCLDADERVVFQAEERPLGNQSKSGTRYKLTMLATNTVVNTVIPKTLVKRVPRTLHSFL